MNYNYYEYKKLKDEKLCDLFISGNDEAMMFLIQWRYAPLLKKLCQKYYDDLTYLEQLQTELLIHLHKNDYHAMRSFGWKSTFGIWLKTVAAHLFLQKKMELIDLAENSISIGEERDEGQINPPDTIYEENMHMVLLMEGINMLEDKDQRFILLREIDGYKPWEIAKLLYSYRKKEGRVKKRKLANGSLEEIIPTADYVYMLKAKAMTNLRRIIYGLKSKEK